VTLTTRGLRSKTGRLRPLETTEQASQATSGTAAGGCGIYRKEVSPVEGAHSAEAVIDNGEFGVHTVRFETGRLARQAAGSALVTLDGETVVLSATTASRQPKDNLDFFPLTVDVEERMYAVGRIPGSFFRREGRPSEDAILTCRLIDRPLRPSFVKGLRNEIQIVETILALDPQHLYDVVAINAASMSTQLAGLPFSGPIGGVRVALIKGQWVAFPTHEQLAHATFDMVVAGRVLEDGDVAIMMVEAESTPETLKLLADEASGAVAPTEETVAEGLEAAKPFIRVLCEAQGRLAAEAAGSGGTAAVEYPVFVDYAEDVYEAVAREVSDDLAQALTIAGKHERETETDRVKAIAVEKLGEQFEGREKEISAAFRALTKKLVRERIIGEGLRIDGRGLTDIRKLSADVGVLPRVHGSALFERGETQILGVTTLNMLRMEQMIDTLNPDRTKRYMHNYNFPPYSTGETGRVGSPKRREIGHGALAERALLPVLPAREEFPYAIRQVSEAISSNGSTSMGSVCASTMSLLNAGVPLKDMVSGIAMGLIHEGGQYVTLTDILGAEDAFGDMDFKVAGTEQVITALQLDTKLGGIPASVLGAALKQARAARMTVLDVMRGAITEPGEMSAYAPRIITIKVPVDKIGEVIGPKGKMINSIQDDTGAEITIEDDGTIYVGATDGSSAEAARAAINAIANPHMPEVGERFLGTVVKTTTFGAFVSLLPGKDGLLHITQIRKLHGGRRIENIDDVVHIGDKIQVEIREVDDRGKLSLVPVEVVEREAAGEDLSGGDSRGDSRGDRPRDRGDRGDRDRGGDRDGSDGPRRTRHRTRGGHHE
jgi:polyribonucleotide nucleotidyltransferase